MSNAATTGIWPFVRIFDQMVIPPTPNSCYDINCITVIWSAWSKNTLAGLRTAIRDASIIDGRYNALPRRAESAVYNRTIVATALARDEFADSSSNCAE